jgi:hypothetical protein
LAVLACVIIATDAQAQDRKPLLMPDKQTLFQRVLTRPGAQLVAQPGTAKGTPQPAFSRFYVYERKELQGKEWLLVGANSRGKTDGWINSETTLPWKQQIALAFTNPANRDRVLMFKNRESVMEILQSEDPGAAAAPIREAVVAGKDDPRVVSIEPEDYVDISKKFYLLPILEAEEVVTKRGYVRVLEVASVTAEDEDDKTAPKKGSGADQEKPKRVAVLRTFNAAIVFVIDSTISMGPYIDRTREAVRRIYEKIKEAGLSDQVKFGLIAYRSSTEAVPGLEYVSKVYVDPSEVKDGQDFLDKVADLQPAKVSSALFDEDAYSGIMSALESVKWNEFGGRYLVVITDAGAIDGSDQLSGTKLGAEQVRIEAEQLGVAIYTLHLKTPQGRRNHQSAEQQYETLTQNEILNKPLYYPVEAGSVEAFGKIVDTLADAMVEQVRGASLGEMVPGSARTVKPAKTEDEKKTEDVAEQVKRDARLLGHAMQLAYLGSVQGTEAPDLFKAWLSDRDFANPDLATTDVKVLLTKNQLSDLRDVVKAILDAGEAAQARGEETVSTAEFFDLLRSSAAHLARDPNMLNDPNASKLGELGLLGEYLEDLPYKSRVMGLTSDLWESWSTSQQEDFLDDLRRKLRHYQIYHDDTKRWVSLSGTGDPGEDVYPVPIKALP